MTSDELREWLQKLQSDIQAIYTDGWKSFVREGFMDLEIAVVKLRQKLDHVRGKSDE